MLEKDFKTVVAVSQIVRTALAFSVAALHRVPLRSSTGTLSFHQ